MSASTKIVVRLRNAALTALLAAGGTTACGDGPDTVDGATGGGADERAMQVCQTKGSDFASIYGDSLTLASARPTTIRKFDSWNRDRFAAEGGPRPGPRQSPGQPDTAFVALCYFDGELNKLAKRTPPGAANSDEPFNRLVVLAPEEGEATIYSAKHARGAASEEDGPPPPA